jgi:hypothetical protein
MNFIRDYKADATVDLVYLMPDAPWNQGAD